MKALISLDLYLWNHFIPKIDADFFSNKFNSALAMVYISFFKLPRKYLMNYFRGGGKSLVVDTKQLIVRNPVVLNKLKDALQSDFEKGGVDGSLAIGQTDVSDPNYRYSIGSFRINYTRNDEKVLIKIYSNYRFQKSPDRITKHLHHWLFTLKNRGKANDFEIKGSNWRVQMNELTSMENQNKLIPDLRGKLMV